MRKFLKVMILSLFIPVLFSFTKSKHHESEKIHEVSWYGDRFHGKKTASGEIYNMNHFTCAATKDYKFGELLEVTNISNGKTVIVYVNDRGGFKKYGRTLDLSKAAFKSIENLKKGTAKVKIKRLDEDRINLKL